MSDNNRAIFKKNHPNVKPQKRTKKVGKKEEEESQLLERDTPEVISHRSLHSALLNVNSSLNNYYGQIHFPVLADFVSNSKSV